MKVVKIGEIAEVGNGNSAPQNEALFKGGTLPFVRTSDVGAIHIGSIESSRDLLTPEGAKGLRLFPAGTILFPKSGASTFLNHRVILNSSAYVSSHLATIKAISEVALDRYIFYFLQVVDARDLCQDQAYPSLNRDQIAGIDVPLPSLMKQETIVKKLDKAFAEIDSLEKNLQLKEGKTNQLLQSMLSAAFTNTDQFDIKIAKLSQICEFSRGLTYKKSDEVEFSKNIVLRANNIDLNTNSLILEDLRYIKDSIKIDPEKLVKKNSLIICTASGSKTHLGKVALITEEFGYSFGGFMGQITPSKDCHHRFLFYIFTSPSFKDFLMGLTDGTNINNLKFKDIENYELQLPKFEDQVKIVMKLDNAFAEIDKLKNQISIEKQRISSLRQSILSDAFNFEVEAA